jgi:hypothetical protein
MKTKITPANNFKGNLNVNTVEFTSREDLEKSVEDFFSDFEKPYGITSNVIGYIIDEDTNESVGYIQEHYVDSGSVDYYYTELIHG